MKCCRMDRWTRISKLPVGLLPSGCIGLLAALRLATGHAMLSCFSSALGCAGLEGMSEAAIFI